MASRIIDCRDALLTFIADVDAEVKPAYASKDTLDLLNGRMVRCFPEVLLDAERLARRRVTKEIKLALVVEALYTEPAAADDEPVPEPWVSEQIEWVETQLFDRVNNKGVLENDLLGNRFRMMNCEWAAVYDVDRLINSKLFWSLINLTYHEQAVVG